MASQALKAKRLVLGSKKFSIPGGKTKTVKVRLSKQAYRVLSGRSQLRAWLKVNARDKAGNKTTSGRAVTVKPPKLKNRS